MRSVHEHLQSLCNIEFSESTSDLRECLSIEDYRAKIITHNSIKLGLAWEYDEPP